MSKQARVNNSEGVTLVQVFGEFKEFKGAMSSKMGTIERELRYGFKEIKSAVADSNEMGDRLTIIEGKQALIYKLLSALGGAAIVLLIEMARRLIFGA